MNHTYEEAASKNNEEASFEHYEPPAVEQLGRISDFSWRGSYTIEQE